MNNFFFFSSLIYFFILLVVAISSCGKDSEEDIPPCQVDFNFVSLIAETDSVQIKGSTEISAYATGCYLSYFWSTSLQNSYILGNGSKVTYMAPLCIIGPDKISCTVEDGFGNSSTKEITIVVY